MSCVGRGSCRRTGRRWTPAAPPLVRGTEHGAASRGAEVGEAVAFRRRPCFVREKLNRDRQALLEDWLGRGSDSRSVG
jgi:hypothetical protein